MTAQRKYTHAIVTYANEEELKPLLKACKHFAYIYHDRDTADPHYHVLAIFDKWKSFNSVKSLILGESNTFDKEFNGDVGEMLDYFTHKGIEGKAQYDPSEIVFDERHYWDKKRDAQIGQDTEQFLDDLMDGRLTDLDMARKYGKDYIRNHQRYHDFKILVQAHWLEEIDHQLDEPHTRGKTRGAFSGFITVDLTYEEWDLIQHKRLENKSKQNNFFEVKYDHKV